MKWLDSSDKDKIDYAVYFESDEIFVCDRLYQFHRCLTSLVSERLERCIFYLDEIHTRRTDSKFPNDFHAAVTLGNGLSKDRLVQAYMRMRSLGPHEHSVIQPLSTEKIIKCMKLDSRNKEKKCRFHAIQIIA